jgi:hypothetical protein
MGRLAFGGTAADLSHQVIEPLLTEPMFSFILVLVGRDSGVGGLAQGAGRRTGSTAKGRSTLIGDGDGERGPLRGFGEILWNGHLRRNGRDWILRWMCVGMAWLRSSANDTRVGRRSGVGSLVGRSCRARVRLSLRRH